MDINQTLEFFCYYFHLYVAPSMTTLGDIVTYGSSVVFSIHLILFVAAISWLIYNRKSSMVTTRSLSLMIYQYVGMISLAFLFWMNVNGYMNCTYENIIKSILPNPVIAIVARCLKLSIVYEYVKMQGEDGNRSCIRNLTARISTFFMENTGSKILIRKTRAIVCCICLQILVAILPITGIIISSIRYVYIGYFLNENDYEICNDMIIRIGSLVIYLFYTIAILQLVVILRKTGDAYAIKIEFKIMLAISITFGIPAFVIIGISYSTDLNNTGWLLATIGFLLVDITSFFVPIIYMRIKSNRNINEKDLNRVKSWARMPSESFITNESLQDKIKKYLLETQSCDLYILWNLWRDITVFKGIHQEFRVVKAEAICRKYFKDGQSTISEVFVDKDTQTKLEAIIMPATDKLCKVIKEDKRLPGDPPLEAVILPSNTFDEIEKMLLDYIELLIIAPYYESEYAIDYGRKYAFTKGLKAIQNA